MNIYKFELKQQLKSSIIWTIAIILTAYLFMGIMFPIYVGSKDEFLKVLQGFPPQFAIMFSLNINTIFSYQGFLSFCFTYISLIGAIMAVAIAISTFAREKRIKCQDFLLSKPIDRSTIFIAKLASNFTILIIFNIIYVITSILLFMSSSEYTEITLTFILAQLSLFLTQLIFLAIGIVIAIFFKKIRSISGMATAIGFTGYILTAIVNLINDPKMIYFAPLKYFEPSSVYAHNNYELRFIVIGSIIVISCIAISYYRYCKSDVHAV